MSFTRRSKRLVALAVGLSLVAAACGDDDDADTADTSSDETEAPSEETEAPSEETEAPTEETEAPDATEAPDGTDAPAGDVAMTLTFDINPDAVLGRRHADHVGRLRMFVAGTAQHAWLDRDFWLRRSIQRGRG